MVDKLNLPVEEHPHPYSLSWFKKGNEIKVTKRCLISFSIWKKYFDEAWCDIVTMDACHILLGRPWQYDRQSLHDSKWNAYTVVKNDIRFTLLSMKEKVTSKDVSKSSTSATTLLPSKEFVEKSRDFGIVLVLVLVVHTGASTQKVEVATLLEEYSDVFPQELPPDLPSMQDIQHRIDLVPGSVLPNKSDLSYVSKGKEELQRQVKELLAKGIQMAMGLFYYGLRDTTATYATNFLNLIPVATFVFSIIAGMEKLRLRTKAGKVKTGGAILCLTGALTISLYKGKSFYIGHHTTNHQIISHKVNHHWTHGSLFLGFSVLSYAAWFVVQAKLFKEFPYKYWATMLTCIIGFMQSTVIGLWLDNSKASWSFGWNIQLITIIYSGALATAASFCLISWTIRHRGPTYPSMFNPLALIFIAIAETLFLDEPITVGSLLGMLLIVSGLYSFLWGKNKESKIIVLPKAIFDETSLVVVVPDQSVVKQSTAVVMPSASTSISTIDAEDGADPNHGEVHGV
ncbi:hypothetical protein HYC85_001468 [Camellia sinensis]|uniref:EamA domain-containing protein n=1 Tax=Camellia sinensis TaxID=4442 RepID=A0A7J7I5R9_CAMSI|nr:hypothetical protein HYC85_001468 [Camellia sinensis]